MAPAFNPVARKLGIASALGTVLLEAAYAVTLVCGLLSLQSPQDPIGDPLFSILELLILALAPLIVTLFVSIHAWAPPEAKALSMTAVVFAGLLAGVTCSVHFVILTLSRHPAFSEAPWVPQVLSFRWPSVAYALDVLAWDVFFPLAVLFAAPAFGGSRIARAIRALLVASGLLALAGLSGVVAGDMRLRNLGILGYVGAFPVAALLMAVVFSRAEPAASQGSSSSRTPD